MSRFFAFGCSFTNYRWMTWADIIGSQFEQYQNWGQAGAGNKYIYASVMEADQRQKFTSDDTVIICWTESMRDDRYVDGRGWITTGSMSSVFSKEFIADYVCERGYLIDSLNMIKGVQELLINRGCKWKFLSIDSMIKPDHHNDIKDVYAEILNNIAPSFADVLGQLYWKTDSLTRPRHECGNIDQHPTTKEALRYLDAVLPGWVTDRDLRDLIDQQQTIWNNVANGSCMQVRF